MKKYGLVLVAVLIAAAGGFIYWKRRKEAQEFAGIVEDNSLVIQGRKKPSKRYRKISAAQAEDFGQSLARSASAVVTTKAQLEKIFGDMLGLQKASFIAVYRAASKFLNSNGGGDLIDLLNTPRLKDVSAAQRVNKTLALVIKQRYAAQQAMEYNKATEALDPIRQMASIFS